MHDRAAVLPGLDGRLRVDDDALTAASDDFGHLVRRRPWAVLEPGSAADVAAMVAYCREHGVPVAARGRGHAAGGQAQVDGGLVIDMTSLRDIAVAEDRATVGAGTLWSDLIRATLPHGLTPPTLTDYLELSVGGTLSAGGLGGTAHRYGAQVDNVIELDVVTGAGETLTCSGTRHADLFHAVLAGFGQCAIITRATVRLVPAPATVRRYRLWYPSLCALTADQRRLVRDGRFDYVEGQVQAGEDGGWRYLLEAAGFDGAAPLGDLAHTEEEAEDLTYGEFLGRLSASVERARVMGEWDRPHPWANVLLPDAATDAFAGAALGGLAPDDIGPSGVILLYPLRRERLRAPLLRAPGGELVFLFSVLRTASYGDPAAMVAANRALVERALAAGGTRYPVGTETGADWRRHFGPAWPRLAAARRRYDPAGVLGHGLRTPRRRPGG